MQVSKFSKLLKNKWFRRAAYTITATTLTTGIFAVAFSPTPVYATTLKLHAPKYDWYHRKIFNMFDHASLRRGYQVYKEVCSACHSMKYVYYRHLVGVVLTEEEAKAHAAEYTILDGPDENGDMFERPRKLTDTMPDPYRNEEDARSKNNGALPADFSYVALARHGNENYIFSLLTGYCDPPAGRTVAEGQHYNPYFPGGALSMARPLYDELIEYEDGTPATTSQMAKDVSTFLMWASDPKHDERVSVGFKIAFYVGILTVVSYLFKRHNWTYLKSMKYTYKNRKPPKTN